VALGRGVEEIGGPHLGIVFEGGEFRTPRPGFGEAVVMGNPTDGVVHGSPAHARDPLRERR